MSGENLFDNVFFLLFALAQILVCTGPRGVKSCDGFLYCSESFATGSASCHCRGNSVGSGDDGDHRDPICARSRMGSISVDYLQLFKRNTTACIWVFAKESFSIGGALGAACATMEMAG